MFSRSKITETTPGPEARTDSGPEPKTDTSKDTGMTSAPSAKPAETGSASESPSAGGHAQAKASPSLLSNDLTIKGNVITAGDVQVEGTVEGDVHAHLLTVGEDATIKGEIVADDVVVHGRVIGRLRGLKVRLTASARVEGDIVHKTIAIESGAHFEGTVQRQEDPIGDTTRRASSAQEPASSGASAATGSSASSGSAAASSSGGSSGGSSGSGGSNSGSGSRQRETAARSTR